MSEILMYSKKYLVETQLLQNQSNVIIWLAWMQRQLQQDCFCHFTGRDIYRRHPQLYAYMWNDIKPIFNQVFGPMTLTCCFCFWRMLRIQVIAEPICLILVQATHTKKIESFDGKIWGSHETLLSDIFHTYQFKKVILINVIHITP